MSKIIKTNLEINDWFGQLNDKVDLWITDPPYPFDNKNGSKRFKHVDGNDGMYSRMTWTTLEDVFAKMYDATNAGGRAYIFCNRDGLFMTKELLEKIGWKFRNLLVWDKIVYGMGYYWRNQAEYICYVSKGSIDSKFFVKNQSNIFYEKKPKPSDSIPSIGYYPTGISPKPYKIWSKIMTHQLGQDEIAADPFAGSEPMRVAIELDSSIKNKIKKAYINSYDI